MSDTAAPDKSDWKVVLQFFIVPLALVAVLVLVFFGLQVMRSHHPDRRATLEDLKDSRGFRLPWVGNPKRWQSGYDLSLLLRSGPRDAAQVPAADLVAAFRDARRSDDVDLRRYLALALGRSGDARAVAALAEALADADSDTRLYCAWALSRIGGDGALAALRAALASSDPAVRKMAAFSAGAVADRAAIPALRGILADPDEDARVNAAVALARMSDAAGVPVLADFLRSHPAAAGPPSPGEEAAILDVVRGLALLRVPGARAALEETARSSRSDSARAAAREAIESLDAEARRTLP